MSNKTNNKNKPSFSDLGLSESILKVIDSIGYETPSPIQEQCITYLIDGQDIIGQAQTGTGKTAAFALPLLDKIDIKKPNSITHIGTNKRVSNSSIRSSPNLR